MKIEEVGKDIEATGMTIEANDRQGGLTDGLAKEPKNLDFEG